MALACAHCGSVNTQVAVDKYQCLDCGKVSNFDGTTARFGPDENTRQTQLDRLTREPKEFVLGNLADLQRMGAQKAADPSETAFPLPPGVTGDNIDTEHLAADGTPSASSPSDVVEKANAESTTANPAASTTTVTISSSSPSSGDEG